MKQWLNNQFVVLTGASGGIGRALAKILVQKYGAKVIGVGRNEEKMLSLQAELGENGKNFFYFLFNVGELSAWENFAEQLKSQNITPRLLINNAGAFPTFQNAVDNAPSVAENIIKTHYLSII